MYLKFNFEVIKKTDNGRYANGNEIPSITLGTIVLFSKVKLTTSSGEKHADDKSNVHIVSLLYELITNA